MAPAPAFACAATSTFPPPAPTVPALADPAPADDGGASSSSGPCEAVTAAAPPRNRDVRAVVGVVVGAGGGGSASATASPSKISYSHLLDSGLGGTGLDATRCDPRPPAAAAAPPPSPPPAASPPLLQRTRWLRPARGGPGGVYGRRAFAGRIGPPELPLDVGRMLCAWPDGEPPGVGELVPPAGVTRPEDRALPPVPKRRERRSSDAHEPSSDESSPSRLRLRLVRVAGRDSSAAAALEGLEGGRSSSNTGRTGIMPPCLEAPGEVALRIPRQRLPPPLLLQLPVLLHPPSLMPPASAERCVARFRVVTVAWPEARRMTGVDGGASCVAELAR